MPQPGRARPPSGFGKKQLSVAECPRRGLPAMMRSSIRSQILGIAVGLIVLMVIVSALSTVMTRRVAHQLDELTTKYVEAYGHLARMQIRSLERSLAIRRMVVAKMQSMPEEAAAGLRKQ